MTRTTARASVTRSGEGKAGSQPISTNSWHRGLLRSLDLPNASVEVSSNGIVRTIVAHVDSLRPISKTEKALQPKVTAVHPSWK